MRFFLRTFALTACLVPILPSIGCSQEASGPAPVRPATLTESTDIGQISSELGSVDNLWTREKGEDWPHFLGTDYDNTSNESGILQDWSRGKLRTLWAREVGTSYGIGSVAAGRYLQFERIDDNERLTCLNAETGEELWHSDQPVEYEDLYGYNNGPRTSPTIVQGAVYTLGVSGQLTCRKLKDGDIVWTLNANEAFGVIQNFFGVGASPLVVDDLVIVMVGGSPEADKSIAPGQLDRVSSNGSAIVAFNRFTGEEVYRTGKYLASYSSPRPAVIGGRSLVLAFVREGLLALDARTGKEAWMFPWRSPRLESVNAAVPVVDKAEILISECYDIGSALLRVGDDGKPSVVWQDPPNRRTQAFRAHWATPLKIGEAIYGSSGRNPGDTDFRCVDWDTGEVLWSEPRRERTSLLGIDGKMIILGEQGGLTLATPSTEGYQPITEIDLTSTDRDDPQRPRLRPPLWAAPIVSHGLLYVRGAERVICMELISDD